MNYQSISNEELEKMVANKDGEAICELGERFLYGKNGSPQNLTRAYQLFHKGGIGGDVSAGTAHGKK